MPRIHATALVDPKAELDGDVEVGPYSVIGAQVRIGAGTTIGPHVVVDGRADEDDAVLEQARVDVVGPLAAVGLLHDVGHGDVGHRRFLARLGEGGLGGEEGHRLVLPELVL